MSLEKIVKPHILDLKAYEPGKPMEELERELGIDESIKLASNENPLGPSPKAVEFLHGVLDGIHRYPDGANFALRERLAERLGVAEAQLVFGCGGDEILELLVKCFVGPGDEVVYPWPSFAMYPIVVQGMGGTGIPVALNDRMEHDLPAMSAAVTERTKLVFVCNPNNPTGTSVGAEAFDAFVENLADDVILAIDEAYFEFVRRDDFPDSIAWLSKRPGTLVLRTFSKIYGLAGLRIGYGIGDLELIDYLQRARHPFNVNRLAEAAALAALDDEPHAARTRELNAQGIDYLTRELSALGIEVWPTDANFLLARTGPVYDKLLREGIIVRPMGGFGLDDCVRISIGTAEENERIAKAMRKLCEGGT
jgi:histidinol-phosphate aminotransferase